MKARMASLMICIAALTVIAAVWVPSASAEAFFQAEEYPATIAGESTEEHEFYIEELGSITCESASFSGELVEESTELAVTPSYAECVAFESFAATVNVNSCEYVFNSAEEGEEEAFAALTDISCGEAAGIEIHIPLINCVITANGQAGIGGVVFKVKWGLPPDLIAALQLGALNVTVENTGAKKCILIPTGNYNANVLGGITIRAIGGLGPYIGLQLK